MVRRYQKLIVFSFALVFAMTGSFGTWAQEKSRTAESVWGPNFHVSRRVEFQQRFPFRHGSSSLRRLKHWNEIAINASGLDHTPVGPGDPRPAFAEQLGPGRSSRAMAIVHIAVFDSINAIVGG